MKAFLSSKFLSLLQSIYGSVQSQEDHGYTLDIGIKGVKAFLSNMFLYCRVYMVVYRVKRTMVIHWILGLKE